MLKEGFTDEAVSGNYYATFHMARALLLTLFYHEVSAEGRQEGEAALLLRLLERRFGPLPEAVRVLIEAADADTLLVWGERLLRRPLVYRFGTLTLPETVEARLAQASTGKLETWAEQVLGAPSLAAVFDDTLSRGEKDHDPKNP